MNCDKCGKPVAYSDDAIVFDAIIRHQPPVAILDSETRHINCSPSRAQYIVHIDFPPVQDDRPEYDKRLKDPERVAYLEEEYTRAWITLQAEARDRDDRTQMRF